MPSSDSHTTDPTENFPQTETLLSVDGRFWVKRGCVVTAWGPFRHECPPANRGMLARMSSRFKVLHRTFALRSGRGLLAANGMRLIELAVLPNESLTVRLERLIAFSDSLEFTTRFIRRVPLSGSGGWHVARLAGNGRAIIAAVGQAQRVDGKSTNGEESDFDPECVLAWAGNAPPIFSLNRLTLLTVLSPQGYRETRMALPNTATVWVDCSARPLTNLRAQAMAWSHKPHQR